MRTWIYGDIHGAGIEFRTLLEQVHREGDRHISVGDAFDRGKHTREVWRTFRKYKVEMVLGNHERKALGYLTGERGVEVRNSRWLPTHYYFAYGELCCEIADELGTGRDSPRVRQYLVDYLSSLPRIIKVSDDCLVTHAGVRLDDPWREDTSANVYGGFPADGPMPRPAPNDGKAYWWDQYVNVAPKVIYGHLVTDDGLPRMRLAPNGLVNSIGLDTFVVHGGNMTAYCPEEDRVVQYRSGINWRDITKEEWKKRPPEWR